MQHISINTADSSCSIGKRSSNINTFTQHTHTYTVAYLPGHPKGSCTSLWRTSLIYCSTGNTTPYRTRSSCHCAPS